MDLTTYLILLIFNLVFDGLALIFSASLFSTVGGIESMSGLAFLINSGSVTLRQSYNGGFINSPASASDYQVYVTMLIILTVTSFIITMGMSRGQKG